MGQFTESTEQDLKEDSRYHGQSGQMYILLEQGLGESEVTRGRGG